MVVGGGIDETGEYEPLEYIQNLDTFANVLLWIGEEENKFNDWSWNDRVITLQMEVTNQNLVNEENIEYSPVILGAITHEQYSNSITDDKISVMQLLYDNQLKCLQFNYGYPCSMTENPDYSYSITGTENVSCDISLNTKLNIEISNQSFIVNDVTKSLNVNKANFINPNCFGMFREDTYYKNMTDTLEPISMSNDSSSVSVKLYGVQIKTKSGTMLANWVPAKFLELSSKGKLNTIIGLVNTINKKHIGYDIRNNHWRYE